MKPETRHLVSQRRVEGVILLALALLALAAFGDGRLDLWAARAHFHPGHPAGNWHGKDAALWMSLYRAAPWLTGLLLAGSIAAWLVCRVRQRLRPFGVYAAFVFLSLVLGPGLVVNALLKPHWGRPRPREVVELGGEHRYRAVHAPDLGGRGKSFPCGHSAVGFTCAAFWWVFFRKNRRFAWASLAGGILLGSLMGAGRMAAGGHFLSDVVWSAVLSWAVCSGLYHFVLRIPEREDAALPAHPGATCPR